MSDSSTIDNDHPRKSEAAFRTISEVATELDVAQHVLRFWESKFSQVRPLKRGGGRRYYRPEDVALLKRIRDLLYRDGLTIKGVQKLFREHGVKSVVEGTSGSVIERSSPAKETKPRSSALDVKGLIGELTELRNTLRAALSARV